MFFCNQGKQTKTDVKTRKFGVVYNRLKLDNVAKFNSLIYLDFINFICDIAN